MEPDEDEYDEDTPPKQPYNEDAAITHYRMNWADAAIVAAEFVENISFAVSQTAEMSKKFFALHSTSISASKAVKRREKLTRSVRRDLSRL